MLYNDEPTKVLPRLAPKGKVIGWLVCIEGKEIGLDYRLVSGYNWVGQSENMEIPLDDPSVAEDHHCALVYDEKHNCLFLVPQEGHDLELNDEILSQPVVISHMDKITIGHAKFYYVAFCQGDRTWKNIAP